MIYYFIVILILGDLSKVLTDNIELSNIERNLLYTHIKTENDLELFYQKIIQSNDVDDLKSLSDIINENDIRDLNFENKVNMKYYFSFHHIKSLN